VPLDHIQPAVVECCEDILDLDEALQRLEEVDKINAFYPFPPVPKNSLDFGCG